MSMTPDMVRLNVVETPAQPGTCELCATGGESLGAMLVVQHARGGEARFALCRRCRLASQRLVATIGGQGQFRHISAAVETRTNAAPATAPAPLPAASGPELVLESLHALQQPDGTTHTIRVFGQARADGTWVGWIEFVGPDGTLRTGRETTQSNREGLAYWATGLEPAYFQGAFERAR